MFPYFNGLVEKGNVETVVRPSNLLGKIMEKLWFPVDVPSNPLNISVCILNTPATSSSSGSSAAAQVIKRIPIRSLTTPPSMWEEGVLGASGGWQVDLETSVFDFCSFVR